MHPKCLKYILKQYIVQFCKSVLLHAKLPQNNDQAKIRAAFFFSVTTLKGAGNVSHQDIPD